MGDVTHAYPETLQHITAGYMLLTQTHYLQRHH